MDLRKVIYIDDEEINLELFQMNFEDEFQVFTSETPEDAIDLIKQEDIKVVITDFRMPKMNGIDLIRAAKEEMPNVVCMILSGFVESEVKPDPTKVFKYITKPYHRPQMLGYIEEAFNYYQSSCVEEQSS